MLMIPSFSVSVSLWCYLVVCLHCWYGVNGFPTKHVLMEEEEHSTLIGPKRVSLSIFLGLLCGFFAAVFVAVIIRFFLLFINTTPLLKGPVVFSPKINPATLTFSLSGHNQNKHHLGSTYYRISLDDGLTVALKTLDSSFELLGSKRILDQHLQLLAGLKHRNLMSLRAYVRHSDSETLTLVYDYMPIGSLEDVMSKVRDNQLQLGWPVRLRVALGIIQALKFLHFDCHPCLLHYNLKPSNVLLGDEFEPKLTDFGLVPKLYRSCNAYRPPLDSSHSSRYTDKSDVFSFGVILGVLVTGRDPLDPVFVSGGGIGKWLRQMQQAGEARKVLDKSIVGQDDEEEEMLMAVRIAVVCLSELAEDRPSTDELVPMLSRLHSF